MSPLGQLGVAIVGALGMVLFVGWWLGKGRE